MMKYAFMSPSHKVEVKGKAIHIYIYAEADSQTNLIGQTVRPMVIDTINPIVLGFSRIRIQLEF